ncbi:MAG: 16S rRNA (cytidine(1402)-2'-O)-methyltransferase [Pseudomonadota bacterium]
MFSVLRQMHEQSIKLEPGLYVVATPIGNLGDITYRAVETLKAADLILCEDTRRTGILCDAYGVDTARAPYHEHYAARVRPGILEKLQSDAAICLVSDAGTPLISDPGYKLVREAREADIRIFPIPGPSSAVAALSAVAAPGTQFHFAGFLPPKAGARRSALEALKSVEATLVFFETAQRMPGSLEAMAEILGDRSAALARELTKVHEEIREGSLRALAEFARDATPKGEFVVLVYPAASEPTDAAALDEFLRAALGKISVREAAGEAADQLGVPRKVAYQRALELKEDP